MSPKEISEYIQDVYADVIVKNTWGETSFFYNPGMQLPNGVYFTTIKEKDGDNDKASNLNRVNVFRLNIGIGAKRYEEVFGPRPPRPAKGRSVDIGCDFTELNTFMPHPIYAWMGWSCILSPTQKKFKTLGSNIDCAYQLAVQKFNKRKK